MWELNMNQEEYIKNLISANKMIGEDILNNPSFTEEELTEVRDRVATLIEQLEFWVEQDNSKRFCYELKNHIQWMIKNYS
jgi:tRNA-dihydrouridine synthase